MTTAPSGAPSGAPSALDPRARSLFAIVGFLVCVELASGVLQGYYTPIFSDIADHLDIADADVNWFEAAQLIVSALVVPPLARLGDLVGHKKVLLLSTAVTALGSWVMAFAPSFSTFLVGSALQGAYVVWLPLEVAIIYRRTAGTGRQNLLTRRAAGDPRRRTRAGRDHRRGHQWRAGRGHVDDLPARAAGDRRDRRARGHLVRHRGHGGHRRPAASTSADWSSSPRRSAWSWAA